jgi:hypothetical protein
MVTGVRGSTQVQEGSDQGAYKARSEGSTLIKELSPL